MRQIAIDLNWIVWLAFCAEFVGKFTLAPKRGVFLRRSWFDLVIIVLSAAVPFKRSARLL